MSQNILTTVSFHVIKYLCQFTLVYRISFNQLIQIGNMVSNDKLKPMTFKVPKFMQLKMQELVANGHYESRAELIREAIQKMINWEMRIDSITDT